MENVYLIGMMGSGKTRTAEAFSKMSGMKAVDLDRLIVARAGKNVNRIFDEDGEAAFRKMEKEILQEVSTHDRQVVSTGGGIILDDDNIKQMRETGMVIYLKAAFPVLWERVKNDPGRPLLKGDDPEKALKMIFDARILLYQKAAHCHVNSDQAAPDQVAQNMQKKCLR